MVRTSAGSDSQARDQDKQHQARKAFTQGLIRAIEDAEAKRNSRSGESMAAAAYDKLQYDFPAVSAEELQALLGAIRASLDVKSGWTPYQLTTKFVENVAAGARRSPPSLVPQQGPGASSNHAMVSSTAATAEPGSTSSPLHLPASMVQVYQQLHSVLVLQYMCKLLLLPYEDAWALLRSYCPDSVADSEPISTAATPPPLPLQQQQQQQHEQQQEGDEQCPGVNGHTPDNELLQLQLQARQPMDPAREAAVPDEDGDLYEDIEQPSCSYSSATNCNREANGHSSGVSHAHARSSAHSLPPDVLQTQQPFSWPALQARLVVLATLADYSLLCDDTVWRLHGAGAHILAVVRALGAHAQSAELVPVLHAYTGLLVDRVSAVPADISLLQQLWEALGVDAVTALPQQGPAATQLPQEAVLAFSIVLTVGQQLGASPVARARLWQQVHTSLLPAMERCAEQLASIRQADTGSCPRDDGLAATLLLTQLLEWYTCNAPRHADVGFTLVNSGILRALVQLFVRHHAVTAGEPVRRALLLAAAASHKAAAWAGAVPGVKQALGSAALAPEGFAAAHGAVWGVLLAPEHDSQQLLTLLEAAAAEGTAGGSSSCLAVVHNVLQLLTDAHAAAKGRKFWGDATDKQLRSLHAVLRAALQSRSSEAKVDVAVVSALANGHGSCSNSNGHHQGDKMGQQQEQQQEHTQEQQQDVHGPARSAADLEYGRVKQLQSACHALLKGLLEQTSKRD